LVSVPRSFKRASEVRRSSAEQEVPRRQREDFLAGFVTEDLGEGIVAVQDLSFERRPVDAGEVSLEEHPVPHLRLVGRSLGAALARHVGRDPDDAGHSSLRVAARRELHLEGQVLDLDGFLEGFPCQRPPHELHRPG
jgi:hypothetical protein